MKALISISIFLSFTIAVQSQEFLDNGAMKLTEIAKSKKYGFSKKKSIKVGSIKNEYRYIAALTGPNGEPISAQRLGSCCPVKSDRAPMGQALLDQWEITYEGLEKPIIIYLNGYDYKDPKCPVGLNFKKVSLSDKKIREPELP